MASLSNPEKAVLFCSACLWLRDMPKQSWDKTVQFLKASKKLGQDDPRRIIHSLKVGLAITLVSMLYYLRPLYRSFGANGIWAVITVIVVMEFSVGATLGKGLNRMLATLLGASLGFGVQWLAEFSGDRGRPIITSFFVFVIAAIMTFSRFVPALKAKYDYGLNIFIMTFSLVSVSGYREHEVLDMACARVLTIVLGSFIAMIVCICIYPVWIGQDLHNLVASNLDNLGHFLPGFGEQYFSAPEDDGQSRKDNSLMKGKYEGVLNSKSREESMANLARWEPCHGQFRFRHPWKQYLRIGNLTRQCANKIEALNFYLTSDIQTPYEVRIKMKDSCQHITSESGKALKDLSSQVKTMTCLRTTKSHVDRAKCGVELLNSVMKSMPWEGVDLLDIVPAIVVASLLTDVVVCIERLSEAVQELSSLAHFRKTCVEAP